MLNSSHLPLIGFVYWHLARNGTLADALLRLEANKDFPATTRQERQEIAEAALKRVELTRVANEMIDKWSKDRGN